MRSLLAAIASVAALCIAALTPLQAEKMPQLTGESLSGKQVSLPSASAGSVAVICIGFSHGSQSELKPWAERARNELGDNPRGVVYSIAVLEDAPRLVRGMAVHGMKSGVPAPQHDHFLVVYHGESELKRVTGFARSDDAYILLLDPRGEIQWVNHGAVTDAALQDLNRRIAALLRTQ